MDSQVGPGSRDYVALEARWGARNYHPIPVVVDRALDCLVWDVEGRELIPETELVQQRDISFNESAVLAKEAEETLLYRDMQTDLVQQLMRRLAAVKTV